MYEKELYLNGWQGADSDTLIEQFEISADGLTGCDILLASYSRDAYCGEAFVLFRQGDKLFEVNASHDSTDGIGGQWEPEETLVAALHYRLQRGRLGRQQDGSNLFAAELAFLLAALEAEGFR